MQFRLLGPLEVDGFGGRTLIDRGKPRALLGLLLLDSNQVVPIKDILDALWGDELPASAEHAVEVYVSRLRRALGADRIRTHPAGYSLRVDEGELDLDRFVRLVSHANEAARSGDPRRAAALLEEAERLWRGPPLPELAGTPAGVAEISRLQEMRLAATEARIDARIAAGEASGVVPELERLVASHPFRERLTGQLMLALYRAGRQADALAAYHDARAKLGEELGVEPGADLQHLQVAILQQDASLDLPRRASAVAPSELAGAAIPRRRILHDGRVPVVVASFVIVVVALSSIGLIRLLPAATAPPSGQPASAVPTTSGETWSATEAALLEAVPTVLRDRCHVTESGEGRSSNATASLHCPPGVGSDADDAWYEVFEGAPSLNAAFAERMPAGLGEGQCSAERSNVRGTWQTSEATFGGILGCFSRDGVSWIVWTYRERSILARAARRGADPTVVKDLYDWWYDIVVELR